MTSTSICLFDLGRSPIYNIRVAIFYIGLTCSHDQGAKALKGDVTSIGLRLWGEALRVATLFGTYLHTIGGQNLKSRALTSTTISFGA